MNDRQRLEAIIKIVNRCLEPLPPGGSLTDHEAMQEIIGLVDPLPPEAPQFVAGEVTRPMCHGAWARYWSEPNTGDSCDQARRWLEAWRAELGPALGLVEIREPTVGECERIDSMYASLDRTSHGRAMFDTARAVMWPKSEAK